MMMKEKRLREEIDALEWQLEKAEDSQNADLFNELFSRREKLRKELSELLTSS